MGIFSRLTDIINSNVNAILDQAEDPEKMVRLMIAEMEDALTEVKSSAAEVVAERIRLERQRELLIAKSGDWAEKAELALQKGREDLAKAALEQKLVAENETGTLSDRLNQIGGIVDDYQVDIGRLEEKLQSARSRQRLLVANHKRVRNRKMIENQIYKVNTSGAFGRFERYENRMDRMEAEAEVIAASNQGLEQEFRDMAQDNQVDAELKALKDKLAGDVIDFAETEPHASS